MRLPEALSPLTFQTYIHELDLRHRVVLSQLALSASTFFVVLIGALFHRHIFSETQFIAGLVLHGLILLACTEIPWDRLPLPSFLCIPLVDFIAIALVREGAGDALSGLGYLSVFPVIWLAASGLAPRAALMFSFVGPLFVVWLPVFLDRTAVNANELTSPMLLPFTMLAVGFTVRVVTASMTAQHAALQVKDRELRAALRTSSNKERLLNTIVEAVGVGVVAVDRNGNDILMNRQQRGNHALAMPPDQDDPDETQLLVFGPDKVSTIPPERRPVRRAIAGETFSDYLIWIGEGLNQRVLSTSAQRITDELGRFDGSVVAFSDVSDMVAAMAAQDDFVSNVSHEFRTPLTSILGYLELIEEEAEKLHPAIVDYVDVVQRNAERLLKLVSDLLATTSNSMTIESERLDLSELIASALESAGVRAHEAGIELVNNAGSGLYALADPERIGQVLDNLLTNAVKYSPGGGTVTVNAWSAGSSVVMQVQDTGMGMDENDRAAAFTKFFRSGAVRNTSIPGVGLGLLITKTIIDRHDGTITVDSSPGAGTTFTITLPMHIAAEASAH